MSAEKIIRPFGELASFVSGSRPQGGVGQIKEGALSLGGEHVGVDGKVALSTPKYVPMDYYEANPKGHIKNGDILLCKDGALSGKVALERGELSGLQSMVNEHVFIIRTEKLDQKYLFYYLFSPIGQRLLKGIVTGAAQGGINGKNLKSIPVVYPDSIPEQRLIVEELDILTNIIDRKNAQMRDLDALSDSLFYEMFGDPSINDRHWETQSLRNLCDKLYAGGDVPKDRLSKEKTSTFSVPILSNGKGDSALYGYTDIPRETSEAITISGRGTIGYSSIQTEPFFPVVRLIVAVPKPSVEISFLQKQLSLMEFESTGGAIPQLTIPMVRDRRLINPPIEIQREYAEKRKLIEQQKSIIFDSLSAVKSLLKNRMDHCFN